MPRPPAQVRYSIDDNIMKKIFILTCVNEEGEVVSVSGHKSHNEAHSEMESAVKNEIKDAESGGFNFDFSLGKNNAKVSYGDENEYKWTITEIDDPVAEDYEIDKSKSQYVENVYFDVKHKFADDDFRILDEPVGDYTGFYFSESEETIWVWNEKKKNYTSIFNLPTETAYEIAKAIDDGEFRYEEEEDKE